MTVYYNENDPFAAAWLRELITEGLIADGVVDERSIVEVAPGDLDGFTQRHFFAGIGGWSYALRLAGWPDDRPVWTGSCPCQPFSAAGKRQGEKDPRHLWPEFRRLIVECGPPTVFGEQVASKDGRLWLAGVRTDMEALGYAVGGADLCAAGVGAPHIRQRLFWVAYADGGLTRDGELQSGRQYGQQQEDCHAGKRLEYVAGVGREQWWPEPIGRGASARRSRGGLGNNNTGLEGRGLPERERAGQFSPWSSGIFIPCADGKARRVEPGIQPLAHGVSNRVGTLRGAGNAIVPQVAATFIEACM